MTGGKTRRLVVRVGSAAIAAATFLSLGNVGNAMAQSASPPSGGSVFTYAQPATPDSLNPLVGFLGEDYDMWATNYDLLINFAASDLAQSDLQHSLVTSVDTSTDGMTFTYHLRPGVMWSDGQPFTAEDAAWTLNFYKKYSVPNYSSDLEVMKTATATDANTLVLTATHPTSFYSGKSVFLYEYILPKHIWGKYENDYKSARHVEDMATLGVGTGPYLFTKYVKNQYVEMDKNPNYWGNSIGLTPHVDKIVIRFYNNEDAEAAGLTNGEVDFAFFNSANILNTLKSKPNIKVRGAIIPSFDEIGFNTGSSFETDKTGGFTPHGDGAHALTDYRVREAIRMAVDSQVLVSKVLLGYGSPGISPVQPTATTGNWQPGPNDPNLAFSIANANTLLDQAGYKKGPNGIRIDPTNNKPLEFRYFTRTSDQNTIETAPYVKSWLNQIGIKIDVQSMTDTKLSDNQVAGTYDIYDWGWYPNPDPNYILGVFTCGERPPDALTYRNSDNYYCNPTYDNLYKEQQTVTDSAKRADIVHQMQAMLWKDAPYVVKWNSASLEAYNSAKWTGFTSQPAGPTGDLMALYGPFSFISLHPVTGGGGGSSSSSPGISVGIWIAIAAVIVILVGLWAYTRRRREAADEDRA